MKLLGGGKPLIVLTISADTSAYNVRTAASSPAFACDVIVTINSGIIVSASGTVGSGSGRAFDTGTGWATGTTIKLINNGFVEGYGGNANSQAGGDAIYLQYAMTIDNTNGYIRGGGGGGIWGIAMGPTNPALSGGGAGGGGGGQGNPGGGHSNGDTNYAVPGTDGGDGSRSAPGSGGTGGANTFYGNTGGDGGGGGTWGNSGDPSGYNGAGSRNTSVGAGGYAVRQNGNGVSFIGGNNSSQVKGTVG